MIKTTAKKTGKKSTSLSRQTTAIVVILALCFLLAIALVVVNFLTATRRIELGGEILYVIREKDKDGNSVYIMADADKKPLKTTTDGYFITPLGALVELNQTTGSADIYARPVTDGNEQLSSDDRIIIFPVTDRAGAQSIKVVNKNGEFAFYRQRVYMDTDRTTYTCMLVDGEYRLMAPEDPSDINSEYVEFLRGSDGYYTLLSGNKISINKRTGAIRSVEYVDFDGKVYKIQKDSSDTYYICSPDGTPLTDVITKTGEKLDSDGNYYNDILYTYYVTEYGTLLAIDGEYGTVSSWGISEYDPSDKTFSVYHFLKRGDKYVLCDSKGELITSTSIDDKDYYCTDNNAYIAFNEENGTHKVRVQKNYYLIADNNGAYSLYNKNTVVASNSAGYFPLPDGSSFIYFDESSGSFAKMAYDSDKDTYTEKETKYLNAESETDVEGTFVIEGHEDTGYDPTLFAALVTNGGYTVTPKGGKLSSPKLLADGSIDFAAYGLVECDRVNEAGETYHYIPSYYVFTDLKGNVHKITFGDKVASGTGFYVKYEGLNITDDVYSSLDKGVDTQSEAITHEAVYILLDNYSMGFTESYETYYYYSITDVFLAPLETLITPMIVPPTSTSTYFDVKDFIISTLNYDELHDAIINDEDIDESVYRDILINFTYYDIEERRNTANSSAPYAMGVCELYGYTINDNSVDACLQALMDLTTCLGVRKLGPSYSDWIRYGLDEPEYIISYELGVTGDKPMLLVSKLTPNNTYYVYTEMYDMIVEVDRSQLYFLSWSDERWLTTDIYNTSIGFCDEVIIEAGNYWAKFDIEMSQTLQTKINPGTASTFTQTVYASDKRDKHSLLLSTSINANASNAVGDLDIIQVDFATLKNYYYYIKSGGKTTGMNADEVTNLSAFMDTISQKEYHEKTGQLLTMHNLTATDGLGNAHIVSLIFAFDSTGEIGAYVQVNKEATVRVFSLKAYEAYEKIIFSEETTANEKKLAYDFYAVTGVSATTSNAFDKITATNSDGTVSEYYTEKIVTTDKDGKVTVDYCLGKDYRVFFQAENGEDLIGVGTNWARFYDMSDKNTTTNGAFEEIKHLPYKFTATFVNFVTLNEEGKNTSVAGGTLGEGLYTVEITEDVITVTDENGNVTRFLRYAGTSVFSNFYATFLWAGYEGICELPEDQKEAYESGAIAPDFKVTIKTKLTPDKNGNGVKFVFQTYQYSERRSFITVNGKGDFFVMRTFIDKIINSSKLIFDNVLIDSSNRY